MPSFLHFTDGKIEVRRLSNPLKVTQDPIPNRLAPEIVSLITILYCYSISKARFDFFPSLKNES